MDTPSELRPEEHEKNIYTIGGNMLCLKHCLRLLPLLLLCSCYSQVSQTTKAVNDAKNTLTALEESIPSECANSTTKLAVRELNAQLEHIDATCNLKIKSLEEENGKKDAIIVLLGLAMGLLLLVRVRK